LKIKILITDQIANFYAKVRLKNHYDVCGFFLKIDILRIRILFVCLYEQFFSRLAAVTLTLTGQCLALTDFSSEGYF
jgi:hypothetical protein